LRPLLVVVFIIQITRIPSIYIHTYIYVPLSISLSLFRCLCLCLCLCLCVPVCIWGRVDCLSKRTRGKPRRADAFNFTCSTFLASYFYFHFIFIHFIFFCSLLLFYLSAFAACFQCWAGSILLGWALIFFAYFY